MKKAATVLVALIAVLLMASCSNDTAQPQEHRITPEVGKPHTLQISSEDTVTLTGLEIGELYGITAPIRLPDMYWSNSDIHLFVASTTSMSFTGAELGISGTGQVTVFKYEAVTPDSETGLKLDTSGHALYSYTSEGYRWDVYEEYYEVDIQSLGLSNLSEVGVYEYVTGRGGYRSDCCIVEIRENGSWRIYRPYGLTSLEDASKLYIFNQIAVRRGDGDGNLAQEIVFENPIKIGNTEVPLNPCHGLYRVSAADCNGEMVLELNIGTNNVWDYDVADGNIEPCYIDDNNWERKPYLFPFEYDESAGTLLLYVGNEEKDFFFDIIMDEGISAPGTIKLRPIEGNEKTNIENYVVNIADDLSDDGKMSIDIPISETEYFRPVIFEGGGFDGLKVRAHYPDGGFWVRLVSRNADGNGYSSYGLDDLEVIDIRDNFILEHAFVRNRNKMSGTVTIELSTNGFDPIDQPIVEVDGATLKEDLSAAKTLSWDSKLVFKNLTPGSFYVLYFGENEDVWNNDEFIWIRDGLIGFLATDTEKEVNVSDFGITDSCQIQFAQFAPSDKFEASASDTDFFLQTEDGYMAIACFKLSDLKTGQPYLFSVDSTEGGNGYPIVLDNRGHELYTTYGNNTYVIDESEMTVVMVLNVWEGEVNAELEIYEPTTIGYEGQAFSLPGLFTFDADPSEELVLEMTFTSNYPSWWSASSISNGSAYNLDTGARIKHFAPFSYDEETNTAVCYIGSQDGSIVVSMPYPIYNSETSPNTIRIRKISDAEKETVSKNTRTIDADPMTIQLPATTVEDLPMAIFLEGLDDDARYEVSVDFTNSDQYSQGIYLVGEYFEWISSDWSSTELREGFGLDTIYLDSELIGPVTITIDKR